jgi:hypothetical protein
MRYGEERDVGERGGEVCLHESGAVWGLVTRDTVNEE